MVEQLYATSADGTQIPYFQVSNVSMEKNSNNPTLLYGYGGFQIPLTPSYLGSFARQWLDNGGVYVIANIRGGGEFGPKWPKLRAFHSVKVTFTRFFVLIGNKLLILRYHQIVTVTEDLWMSSRPTFIFEL